MEDQLLLFPQQMDRTYKEDFAYLVSEARAEDLSDKIASILKRSGIQYSFNALYAAFEWHFEEITTTYKLQIFKNSGPYATPNCIEKPLIVVPTVYGNDRSLNDYHLMRVLGNVIQDGDGDCKSEKLESILRRFIGSTDIENEE